jgi:hypothetical protein
LKKLKNWAKKENFSFKGRFSLYWVRLPPQGRRFSLFYFQGQVFSSPEEISSPLKMKMGAVPGNVGM